MYTKQISELKQLSNQVKQVELKNELKVLVEKLQNQSVKVKVINAGLVKAGKSALFNALANQELFKTDVVRATVMNDRIELNDYILIDTPGLDANEQDDEMAFEGYREADYLVFVHNVMEGELNKLEVESIQKIAEMVGGNSKLLRSSIMLLSHADQLEEENVIKLEQNINKQCQEILGGIFAHTIKINSVSYMKGIKEGKELLIRASHIDEVRQVLAEMINKSNGKTLFNDYLKEQVERIRKIVEKSIECEHQRLLELKERQNNKIDMHELNQQIHTAQKVSEELGSNRIDVKFSIFYPYVNERSYNEYRSESQARSAARASCEEGIQTIVSSVRKDIREYARECRGYTELDGKIGVCRNQLLELYNSMRESYYRIIGNLEGFPEFNIELPKDDSVRQLKQGMDFAIDCCGWFDRDYLKSTNHYLTAYQCNLDIDYDYRTEYVSGFFGSREKEYKVYSWDISGAIEDIKDDVCDIIGSKQIDVKNKCEELFKYQIKYIQKEFNNILQDSREILNKNMHKLEIQNKEVCTKLEEHKVNIKTLQQVASILDEVKA